VKICLSKGEKRVSITLTTGKGLENMEGQIMVEQI